MPYYACIDIGGTAIKYSALNGKAEIQFSSSMPTGAERGPSVWLMDVVRVVEEMKKNYDIKGIAVSSTAMIDSEKGTVVFSLPQVPDYTGFDVKGFLERHCQLPCEVENDVNSMVLAEAVAGAGRGYESVLGLAVGTGIGGGFTLNGKLYHGATFSACELGYVKVGDSDLEHTGSTTALCRRVEKAKGDPCGSWNGLRIFECALNGDEICRREIEFMADSIAQGLGTLSYILNPAAIVLGGGVMDQRFLFDRVKELYPSYVKPVLAENTAILPAFFGNEAGMIGAFFHFKNKHSIT
ncbi:MAG: ROK family protein [Sphaerochaetaceae bacterium]|nr:ROK family protein [Sphaerochaetaceae bacterium]